MNRLRFKIAAAALLSWLLLTVLTWSSPQGLHYYDPVVQLKALQQNQNGVSPAWNVWVRVDPLDLAHDLSEPVGWWPPSIPAFTHVAVAGLGLNLGSAVRGVVILVGGVGAIGWALWWACFALPVRWLFALAVLVPWLRAISSLFFRFSGELFAYAAAPWLFLGLTVSLTHIQRNSARRGGLVLTGLLAGVCYGLKYSLGVIAFAACVGVGLLAWRFFGNWRQTIRPLLLLGLPMGVAPLALKAFNAAHAAGDPAGRMNELNLSSDVLLFLVANPALALADAFGPLFQVFVYPGGAGLGGHDLSTVAWIGVPGGLLLVWLLAGELRRLGQPPAISLGAATLPIFAGLMLPLWLTSDVAHDARLFGPAAIAALPVALLSGRHVWSTARLPLRAAMVLAGATYIVVPLAYGPFYVMRKIAETHRITPGPTGFNLPSLGTSDQHALLASLPPSTGPTVWIVEDIESALELPGRVLTTGAGRSIAEDMRNIYRPPANLAHWRTSAPVELRALSSDPIHPPVKLTTLRSIAGWRSHALPRTQLVLWTTQMLPLPDANGTGFNDPSSALPGKLQHPK